MARSAGNSLAVLRSVLASDASLLLFVAIDLGGGRTARLVKDSRHWTAAGFAWQRAEVIAEFPAESGDGSSDTVTLRLGNLSGVATPTALRGELSGRLVTMSLAKSDELDEFDPALTWVMESTSVSVDAATLVITCGQLGGGDVMPKQVYTRGEFPQLGSPT